MGWPNFIFTLYSSLWGLWGLWGQSPYFIALYLSCLSAYPVVKL